MSDRDDIPLSGVHAAQARQAAAAHNVANLQTDGFEKRRVTSAERPDGGVGTSPDTVLLSEEGRSASEDLDGAQNKVDLVEGAVEQILARTQNTANIRVLRTAQRMFRSVLDLFA